MKIGLTEEDQIMKSLITILFLQISIVISFFLNLFAYFPFYVFNIVWGSIILIGITIGVKEIISFKEGQEPKYFLSILITIISFFLCMLWYLIMLASM